MPVRIEQVEPVAPVQKKSLLSLTESINTAIAKIFTPKVLEVVDNSIILAKAADLVLGTKKVQESDLAEKVREEYPTLLKVGKGVKKSSDMLFVVRALKR